MVKLHPHLKHFIRSVVQSELHESVGPSKKYEWKEGVMREVQTYVLEKLGNITTQQELETLVDSAMLEFRQKKLEPILQMITRVLKQVPVDVLRRSQTM